MQTALDILDTRFFSPVPLRRKINDVSRIHHSARFPDKHLPRANFFRTTRLSIGIEVLLPGLLELQGNALAHETVTVNSIDEGFSVNLEKITCSVFNHSVKRSPIIPIPINPDYPPLIRRESRLDRLHTILHE